MKSLYDFIVEPLGDRYANSKKISEKKLILNTKIESWKFVNRFAKVISTPSAIKTPIKKGDIIVVHQNIFRRFYNMKGKQQNSRSFFKNNMYFVGVDQVYLYKNEDKWISFGDRCFIMPLKNTNDLSTSKEEKCVGILKIGNNTLEASEINSGDKIGFKPGAEWEFIINNERLYCMKSNDIVIKYEYKGNEEEYNPSWTSSSQRVNQGC
jgi:co-chaperonin GroES (HSP10)